MDNFEQEFNKIMLDAYHNMLLMEETHRKYSKASFSFRDRNAIAYILRYPEGTTLGDVANYLRVSRPSTTSIIKKLERYGLVERYNEPGNNRNILVKVTKKGRRFYSYQKKYRESMINSMCEGLGESDREVLYGAFSRLNDFFAQSIYKSEQIHK